MQPGAVPGTRRGRELIVQHRQQRTDALLLTHVEAVTSLGGEVGRRRWAASSSSSNSSPPAEATPSETVALDERAEATARASSLGLLGSRARFGRRVHTSSDAVRLHRVGAYGASTPTAAAVGVMAVHAPPCSSRWSSAASDKDHSKTRADPTSTLARQLALLDPEVQERSLLPPDLTSFALRLARNSAGAPLHK